MFELNSHYLQSLITAFWHSLGTSSGLCARNTIFPHQGTAPGSARTLKRRRLHLSHLSILCDDSLRRLALLIVVSSCIWHLFASTLGACIAHWSLSWQGCVGLVVSVGLGCIVGRASAWITNIVILFLLFVEEVKDALSVFFLAHHVVYFYNMVLLIPVFAQL